MITKPSLDDIRALRDQGNLCPIYAEILADLETPVSAFVKIAGDRPHSFLLERSTVRCEQFAVCNPPAGPAFMQCAQVA